MWTYLDGLSEGDTGKLGRAFHEISHLIQCTGAGGADVTRATWFAMVNSRPRPTAALG
ncbi:MAG TPA: nuclear transport factor 2 family protein [Hyphomicrobiaceae bacterium]|nr:nuclear transport factor 2 family protein [Hyphomicrobiaceae bacterium]